MTLRSPDAVSPILARIRTLRFADVELLDRAVAELAQAEGRHHRSDLGFYYAWYEGPSLRREQRLELDNLFGTMCVALATGVTGIDVERFGAGLARPPAGVAGGLGRWLAPPSHERQLQEAAIGLIEEACRPLEPRRAVVGCWNAICSVLFRGNLPEDRIATLEAGWRRAFGDIPE